MKTFLVSFLVLMGSGLNPFQAAAQSIPASPDGQVDQLSPRYTGYTYTRHS